MDMRVGPYSGFRPSPESLTVGYFVPDNRWFERLGGCFPPGLSGVLTDPWTAGQPLILCLLAPADWPRRLVLIHDDSTTSSLSLSIRSCSTGFQVRLPGYRLLFPLHPLIASR